MEKILMKLRLFLPFIALGLAISAFIGTIRMYQAEPTIIIKYYIIEQNEIDYNWIKV